MRVIVALFASAALMGCDNAPPATPVVSPPNLTRPTAPVAFADGDILVPPGAVVTRGGVPGVFVVEQGLARFRMVRAVPMTGGRQRVLSGLRAGEVLVLGDLREVRDGSPLAPRQGK